MAKRGNRRLRELADEAHSERTLRFIPGEEEGPILSRVGFFLGSVLVFAIVAAGAVFFGSRAIERGLEESTIQVLRSEGYDDVAVVAEGRDLQLTGFVPSEGLIDLIPSVVRSLKGVRMVAADLRISQAETLAEVLPADPLTIVWAGGRVTVTGTVSTEDVKEFVMSRLDVAFPDAVNTAGLEVVEGVADEDVWLGGVLLVVTSISGEVGDGRIVVNSDASVITVSAELPDRQTRADLRRETEEILAVGPLDLVSGLTVEDAPPPPPPEQVVELQDNLVDLIAGKVVEFEVNSDELTTVGEALLDDVLVALRKFPDVGVEIAGHTDSTGTPGFNLDLSLRRAQAVLTYLAANGEDPERFAVVGYGEEQPMADNDTVEGKARNRRIEFIALED